MKKNYIIFSHPYGENDGGAIVLHRLCDLLNKNGETAYLWPYKRPLKGIREKIKYFRRNWYRKFRKNPTFDTPIASPKHLKDAIVVYPETVSGNPLCAKNVVRWFLHKPGFHTGEINYGENELYFLYSKVCDNTEINPYPDNILEIRYLRDDIYKEYNFGNRDGSAYMIRKGKGRPIIHELKNSILVDNFSHEKLCEIFNKVKYFISYDPYTLYSRYAAICGCISIIIPEDNISKEEWEPIKELRYGLAYGFDDIEYAIQTQKLVLPYLKKQEEEVNSSVKDFIQKTNTFFAVN